MKLCIILGDNLHKEQPQADRYFMAETKDLATHYKYHKYKLVLFFASMRNFADSFEHKDKLTYQQYNQKTYEELLKDQINKHNITELVTYKIEDKFFENTIEHFTKKHDLKLTIKPSRKFITTRDEFKKFAKDKSHLLQNDFYIKQRKQHNILIKNGEPEGGKWSFDEENRKKFPKNIDVPPLPKIEHNKITEETIEFINTEFPNHPGNAEDFFYPTTHEQAQVWLDDFLQNRLDLFGPYEDAIHSEIDFGFHSILSPLINIGLIEPQQIIDQTLNTDAKLQSKEGFIRQIIGWREFIRGVYHTKQTSHNQLNQKNKLTKHWYEGTTGILPLDTAIKRANKYAYTHHIERLMVIGNCMMLCRIDPDEVYKWFMEMYIDSADWVMEPNVYAMSQFADDYFATKPYICGSNYIKKMSDYKNGEWCETLDGLYWKFIADNKELFAKNHRMSMMIKLLEKMDGEKKIRIFKNAERFIKEFTK